MHHRTITFRNALVAFRIQPAKDAVRMKHQSRERRKNRPQFTLTPPAHG